MVYKKKEKVNWCFNCNSVLQDYEIINGTCWLCHDSVSKKESDQWYVRITKYADRLLKELNNLTGWSEHIK